MELDQWFSTFFEPLHYHEHFPQTPPPPLVDDNEVWGGCYLCLHTYGTDPHMTRGVGDMTTEDGGMDGNCCLILILIQTNSPHFGLSAPICFFYFVFFTSTPPLWCPNTPWRVVPPPLRNPELDDPAVLCDKRAHFLVGFCYLNCAITLCCTIHIWDYCGQNCA